MATNPVLTMTDNQGAWTLASLDRRGLGIGRLRTLIQGFYGEYADLQYDLWAGGRSKAGRLVG